MQIRYQAGPHKTAQQSKASLDQLSPAPDRCVNYIGALWYIPLRFFSLFWYIALSWHNLAYAVLNYFQTVYTNLRSHQQQIFLLVKILDNTITVHLFEALLCVIYFFSIFLTTNKHLFISSWPSLSLSLFCEALFKPLAHFFNRNFESTWWFIETLHIF